MACHGSLQIGTVINFKGFCYIKRMPRQRMLFIVIVFAALLAACSTAGKSASANPTPSPGKYDGSWQAHIITKNGLEINLFFRISDSVLSWLTYTYNGQADRSLQFWFPLNLFPLFRVTGLSSK